MKYAYVLLDINSGIAGVYQSMKKAKQAANDYVLELWNEDIKFFEKFVKCADEPLVLTIHKFPVDDNPVSDCSLLGKTTEYTRAYVTWDNDKCTYDIEYKPFNPFPED